MLQCLFWPWCDLFWQYWSPGPLWPQHQENTPREDQSGRTRGAQEDQDHAGQDQSKTRGSCDALLATLSKGCLLLGLPSFWPLHWPFYSDTPITRPRDPVALVLLPCNVFHQRMPSPLTYYTGKDQMMDCTKSHGPPGNAFQPTICVVHTIDLL